MYRSWIEKQRSEEDGLSSTEASALQEYLDLKLNVDAAAIDITNAFTAEGGHGSNDLWFSLLDIAQEFPDQHEQLVRLLLAITKMPDEAERASSLTTPENKTDVGNSLKYFGWEVRDRWNYFDPPPSTADRSNQRRLWINLNAFTARLAASLIPDLVHFGLWSLREALEDNHQDLSKLDGLLPAAAQWIFHAGELIYGCEDEIAPDPQSGDPYKGGDLWAGKHGFCKERWQLWRQRFEWAAESADLQAATKQAAREAVVAMRKIDGSSGRED